MTTAHLQRTILIVDDSPEDREAYRRYLTKESHDSYQVVEAELGNEVLALYEQFQPDIVLLDYNLPDRDGLKVLEQLKAHQETLPIIMLTGQGDETIAVQAIKKGAEDYLIKGQTTPSKLQLVVENALENAELRQQLQRSEQQFRVVVNNLFDCLGIYSAVRDHAGQIVDFEVNYLNAAAHHYQQTLHIEHHIGQRLGEVFPENRENGLFEAYCQVVETDVSFQRELIVYADENQSRVQRATELQVSKIDDGFVSTWRDITSQKQLELDRLSLIKRNQEARAAAEREQERYELAAAAVNCLIYDWDLQTQVVMRSQGLQPLLGYTPAEAETGSEWWRNRIHPYDLLRTDEDYTQRLTQHDRFEVEYRVRHREGHYIWVLDHGIALRDAQGNIIRIVGSIRNISQRKQTEEFFKERGERLSLALDAAKMGSWDWNLLTDEVKWSHYHEAMFGYEPGTPDRTFADWIARIYPPDLPHMESCLEQAKVSQQQYQCEYRVVWPDGSLRWIAALGRFYYDSHHQPIRMIGMVNDITERKQSEVTLKAALQKLNFHVENSPLAVIEWDEQFRVCRWSAAAEQMFGWRAEEVMGKNPFDWSFIWLEDVTSVRAVIAQFIEGKERRNVSANRNYRKDGTVVYCEWYNSTLTDEWGQLISVLSLVQNVSDRAQLEAERERILQLEQDARAEAEAANQAKDDFIAVVSHELRSPLNSLLGWTKLIRMGRIDAETMPQALQAIERGAQAQVQIVDDLLDISRMIRGKINLTLTPCDLTAVTQTAISLARPAAEAKRIHLEKAFEAPLNLVASGDSQRIQQILGNLLTNAIKFTPPGGSVEVNLEQIELPYPSQPSEDSDQPAYPFSPLPAPHYAKITIQDTGKGISAELLPHIFDRFRQDKRIAGKTKDGLGLGLAIVQQLVEMHQGKVWAESSGEGQGATFTVLLPLMPASATAKPITDPTPIPSQLGKSGIRILVVDDDPDIVNFLKFALENQGAIVSVGINAQQGAELFSSFKPDLIVSDIGMPGEDGYAFIQRIRELEARQGESIPAIALTAFTQPETRERVLAAGYQLYLTKPIEPDDLVEAIVSLLKRSE